MMSSLAFFSLHTYIHTYIHTLLARPQGAFQSQIYIIQLNLNT